MEKVLLVIVDRDGSRCRVNPTFFETTITVNDAESGLRAVAPQSLAGSSAAVGTLAYCPFYQLCAVGQGDASLNHSGQPTSCFVPAVAAVPVRPHSEP